MTTKAVTSRQASYIRTLIGQLAEMDPEMDSLHDLPIEDFSRRQASKTIDTLKVALAKNRAEAAKDALPELEPGYYLVGGNPYQVKRGRNGNLFACSPNNETGRYEYSKGLIFKLDGAVPITLDEAAAFGKVTGRCIVCWSELHAKKSVERGIGPVCAKKFA